MTDTEQLIQEWMDSPAMGRFTNPTRRQSRTFIRGFSRDVPLLSATTADVEAWLAERTITPATRRIYLAIFARFFEWACVTDLRPDNPVDSLVIAARHPSRGRNPGSDRPEEPQEEPERRCGECLAPAGDLRRLGGEGPQLCDVCYQRGRRWRGATARANGDPLYVELVEAGLSTKTIRLYMRTVSTAQEWFSEQGWHLATATGQQIADYARTVPDTWASRKGLRSALARYWKLTGHPRPPLAAIRVPPKPAMVCRALDEEDARILAKAARARTDLKGLAVLLAMYAGLRREEVATLTWDAFSEDGWMTLHGKNRKRRTIPLHLALAGYLAGLTRTGPYVFPGRFDGPANPATIWQWIAEVAEDAGVAGVQPHRLRHTALATQNDATGDLRSTQAFAGHSSPTTTAGYTRASRRRLQEAVRAIDY